MTKMVDFECSIDGTDVVHWVRKEVKSFNIKKEEVPENAIAFWKNGQKILIGRLFTRAELAKMAIINEELAKIGSLVDYNDAYGAILRKDGTWKCWQKGEKVVDLL